jgi:RNA-directed DNA polymerase
VWSSQQYIELGLLEGHDPATLHRSADAIEEFLVAHPGRPALLTLKHLAVRAGVEYSKLRALVGGPRTDAYGYFRIRKRSGGRRLISVPRHDLMRVQRWIATYVLAGLPVHRCSHAFSAGSSIVRCAQRHCGAKWLIKMDVSGFFGSISEIQIYHVFCELGYEPLVAFEMARLTTHVSRGGRRSRKRAWQARTHASPIKKYRYAEMGFLPQGAPTSPMLSNLAMRKMDMEIEAAAKAEGLRYTRYSDDLTFSTRKKFGREPSRRFIVKVTRMLAANGLRPNVRKTVVVPPGARKVVLGLLVDGIKPRLSREFHDRLRQHLYYLEKFGPRTHAERRDFDTIGGMYRHIRGLIDFANMVEPEYAAALRLRFESLSWLSPPG